MATAKAHLLALILALWAVQARAVDFTHYCTDDAANVVLYLDVTTPYDDIDKRSLVGGIDRIYESLSGGDRLSIRTIEEAFARSGQLIEACVPSCPPGMLGDFFSACTEGVVINDTKVLRRAIVKHLAERLNQAVELPHSDIVRTIALKSREEFAESRTNRIYIFSDMIENSDYLSGAEFWRQGNVPLIERLAADRLIPNLAGATVKVFGIGRGGSKAALPQERLLKLQDFWTLYFSATGATVTLQQNLGFTD